MSFESVYVPTDFDLWAAGLLTGDLGFISAYKDVPRIELLRALGQLYKTSTRNVTSEDIANLLKTTVKKVDTMKFFYNDAKHGFDFYAQYISALIPELPHPTMGKGYIALFVILGLVTLLALVGRLYARRAIEGEIRLYDWVIVAAFVMAAGSGISTSVAISTFASPRTNWDLSQNGHDWMQAIGFANFFLYSYAMLLIKLSILIFYYGLTNWRPLRWSVIGTMAIVVISTITCTILDVFKTKPILMWTDRFFNKQVLNGAAILLSLGVFLILTDVLVWLLPLPMVWKLKNVKTVSRTDRWYAVIVFGLGMIVVAASVTRILIMRTNLEALNGLYPDMKLSMVSMVEMLVAIICACFPALRALYNKYPIKWTSILKWRRNSTSGDDAVYLKGSMERIRSKEIV